MLRGHISRAFSFNPGAKFLILFHDDKHHLTKTEKSDLAFKIFELMYNRYNAANVIFLYAIHIDTYNIYVTNPYRNPKECGSLEPILLDKCTDGTLQNDLITKSWARSSKVPKTLPNCVFKFCARIAEPYINEGCSSGLEMQIIEVLQEILEFKVGEPI